MSPCPRPLDPIDAEAVAAGARPALAADAAEHARECAACGAEVAAAARLVEELESLSDAGASSELAQRVLRVRSFSPRERRSLVLWRGPYAFSAALFLGGCVLLALPGITAREQAGLAAAVLAPLAALLRGTARALLQWSAAAPAGLSALSETLRQQRSLGLAALLLLLPAAFGLRWALARTRR